MENQPFLYETVQNFSNEEVRVLLLNMVKNLLSQHKTPWEMTKRTDSESYAIRDDWGKVVVHFIPKNLAEQLIAIAEDLVKGYEASEQDCLVLQAMWKEAKQKYKDIDIALEKEDENDFRNRVLIS